MKGKKSNASVSVDNIYKLDGRVPVAKAIPFGLQHVLAMFVANVTPVMLIASVAVYNGWHSPPSIRRFSFRRPCLLPVSARSFSSIPSGALARGCLS